MNKKLLATVAKRELAKRTETPPPNLLGECFQQQVEFITSDAKRKILCLTRRAGKSTAAAIYLVREAIQHPNSSLLYIHLTRDGAKRIMWHDIFESIFIKLGIEAELVENKLEIRFANKSIIYLTGVDATPKEMQKIRGKKFRLAVIDECQSYTQDLKQLIVQVLTPTLADAHATICLCGTPGDQMGEHYWWVLNRPDTTEKGWAYFNWSWKDNPHVRENMQRQVNDLIASNPLVVRTPWYRQEYLGEWVPDTDKRIYRSEEHNYVDKVPSGFLLRATFLLSIDLGYTDATAFVVSAYNRHFDDNFYVLESSKRAGLTITEVANIIKEYRKKYAFKQIIIDAAARQSVEEMRQHHALPLTAADKQGKPAHIAALNSDFITSNVKVIRSTNQELIKELNTLIWDLKALTRGKHQEDPKKTNHLCDALLYGHHASRHYWYRQGASMNVEEEMMDLIEEHYGKKQKQTLNISLPWWTKEEEY